MQQWNLTAEWIAAVYTIVLILYSEKSDMMKSMKDKIFHGVSYVVLITIIANLCASYLIMSPEFAPVWITELATTFYFFALPLTPLLCFYCALNFIYCKHRNKKMSYKWLIGVVPYIVYSFIIFLNYIFHNVFTITEEGNYIQGDLYRLPYLLSYIYTGSIVYFTYKNRKNISKQTIGVVYSFPICSLILLFFQMYRTDIILTGTAGCATIIILRLYLKNDQKTTDSLTGLLNRETLLCVLDEKISEKKPFVLAVFSLRNFKSINERMGLVFGNDLLETISEYLMSVCQQGSSYRYSGDEFAVVFNESGVKTDLLLEKIFQRFKKAWVIDDSNCSINVIYSRVDYPSFGKNMKDIMSALDYSIAKLKTKTGETASIYDIAICEEVQRKNEVVCRLKEAIKNDGIEVFYQPIYSAKENEFMQAEALMRLKGNESNPIYPDEFIPIAVETGLIIKLTYMILETVCSDLRKMLNINHKKLAINAFSINFPYVQFLQPDMVECVMKILDKYQIKPNQIRIEITERTLVANIDSVKTVMSQMQEAGFIFELDDFGIDYSNISLFLKLPINIIKIDRSLMLSAVENTNNKQFFECLIKGMKKLETTIIVEGVEEQKNLQYLLDCGCDSIQGFYFSKPLPYQQFLDFLIYYQKSDLIAGKE